MTSSTAQPALYALDSLRKELGAGLHAALTSLAPRAADGAPGTLGLTETDIGRLLEQPPESRLGDFALPCFRFAKDLKMKPPEIAQALAAKVLGGLVAKAEVASAFLNLYVESAELAARTLPNILSGATFKHLAQDPVRSARRVMVEYSQPNTHKEFHVGHARNVCLGQSLVRLYRYCGYQVTAANYFGDDGTHIATILWYLKKEGLQPPTTARGEWLGGVYVKSKAALAAASDDDKKKMQAEISVVHAAVEAKQGETYALWQTTRQWSLDDFDEIYRWLDVHFDVLFYESEMTEAAQQIVDEFLKKGVFVEDQGAVGVDLKPFKLGFCILRKRDGNTLYATKDLVLARRKFEEFKIDRSVYVVADEQNHHFKQVFKVLELMGFANAKHSSHLSYGMVMLPEGKMSSRDGTSVTFASLRMQMLARLGEILEKYRGDWSDQEIQTTAERLCDGAIKYGMVATDPVNKIVFNMDDWLSFEGDSGPYLMYSFTRTRSILKKATEAGAKPDATNSKDLTQPAERELMRYLYEFNNTVALAAESCRPSALAHHLFHTCKAFNRFYAEVPVLKADRPELRDARLALVEGFSRTLQEGLGLLGIRPPDRM